MGTGAPKFRISGDTQSCRRFCSDSAVRFLVFQHHAAARSTALSALTVGWTAGAKTEWWGAGVVRPYLSGARCGLAYGPADATATHCLFASVKSRLVLPFWYRLTRVVPDKGPLNGRVCAAAKADSSLTKSSNDFWRSHQNCYPEDLNPTRFVKSKYGYSVTH